MDISQKIASLAEAHRETMSLITKLRKMDQINPNSEGAEIVAFIHHNLKESEQELEVLQTQIEDEPFGDQKTNFMSKWSKLSEDTKIARVSFRKAQMEVKRNVEELRKRERELLLGHKSVGKRKGKSTDKLSQEELLIDASDEITVSLRRTHDLMSSELDRSQFTSETLAHSTLTLKELSTRYAVLDDILYKSRRLITDLVRKNKSDSWYYKKALYIMISTAIWLFLRRFVYGPFLLLVWLPLKISWWLLSLGGALIGAGGGYEREITPGGGGVETTKGFDIRPPSSSKIEIKGMSANVPVIPASISPDASTQTIESSLEVKESEYLVETPYSEDPLMEPEVGRHEEVNDEEAKPPSSGPTATRSDSILEEIGQIVDNQRFEQAVSLDQRHDEL